MDVSKLMDVKDKMIELEDNNDVDMINLKSFLKYEVSIMKETTKITRTFYLDSTNCSISERLP